MNVYDFDGTIYNGDSGVDFVKFMFCKRPFLVCKYLFMCIIPSISYCLKEITFQELKEKVFAFVKVVDDLKIFTEEFAELHKNDIKKYYLDTRKDNDVIVSASLDFYLVPLCDKIGIKKVICTKYDVNSGKIVGVNCKGDEKVKRFDEIYGKDAVIENAFGDSESDVPIIKRAKNGFIVRNNEFIPYSDSFKF